MEGGGTNNNNNNNNNNPNNNNNIGSTSTFNMDNNVGLYHHHQHHPMMMIPPFASHHHHPHHHHGNNDSNKVCCSSSSSSAVVLAAAYDHHHHQHHPHHQQHEHDHDHEHHVMDVMEHHHQHQVQNLSNNINNNSFNNSSGNLKAKIMAHPHYPRLLSAYVSCQKVGAPPEVVARLEEAEAMAVARGGGAVSGFVGEDPALDQFMEAYCEMLTKYEQELTKPFKEAMIFLSRIECQLKALTLSSPSDSPSSAYGKIPDRNGSSEEDIDVNNNFIDPSAEDRELKGQLLRKYSGYLGSLRQEFLKKRKKGKLPKEARQQLLDWWSRHYKWPYPSESQKLALAESTGLDQKQINNWFINQRKRHWKPSEDMQFVVMDAASHSHAHHYGYMENVLGNPFPMDVSPTLM